MGEETVNMLIEGGSASAGPPLGPSLAPIDGVDVGEIVNEINKATEEFEGMEVPVDVIVDEDTGEYEIEVGKPPTAVLIMDELDIDGGSGEPNTNKVADMDFDLVCKIARMKHSDLISLDLRGSVKEVIGTAQSMGVTIDGKEALQVQEEIENGEYDDQLEEQEGVE